MSALWIIFCIFLCWYITRKPKPADPTLGGRLVPRPYQVTIKPITQAEIDQRNQARWELREQLDAAETAAYRRDMAKARRLMAMKNPEIFGDWL